MPLERGDTMIKDIIVFGILLLIAIGAFVVAYLQYKERWFLLNNAYLYASKKQKETMNKKPYYRQSAIVFSLLGLAFLLMAYQQLIKTPWVQSIITSLFILTVVYAIVSTIVIEKKKK